MKTFVSVLTFLLVAVFMTIFYSIVSFVIGALWGIDVSFIVAIRCGITAYVLSIVLPMILVPSVSADN